MRTNWLAILTVAALTATGASAATARQNASTNTVAEAQLQASAAAGKAEKKICRRLETTGSRFTKKACHTAEEWKRIDAGDF